MKSLFVDVDVALLIDPHYLPGDDFNIRITQRIEARINSLKIGEIFHHSSLIRTACISFSVLDVTAKMRINDAPFSTRDIDPGSVYILVLGSRSVAWEFAGRR